MAEQALKSIPNKALKKIIQQGTLASLLATAEGKRFFEVYLKDPQNPHSEFSKYWDFYVEANSFNDLNNLAEELDHADECFKKYIAIEAEYDHRIVNVINRATVNEISKSITICKENNNSPKKVFLELQTSSLDYLESKIFRPYLISVFQTEKDHRMNICCIN